jgi:hypothetical protein
VNVEASRALGVALALATLVGCSARSMLLEGSDETETEPPPPVETGKCRSVCDCVGGAAVFVVADPGANGKCFNACDGACGPGGAVENSLSTLEDLGDIPHCQELCARIDDLGCGVTCAELIGACRDVDPGTCPPSAEASFACLATTATAICSEGGVRFDGCTPDGLATCGAP